MNSLDNSNVSEIQELKQEQVQEIAAVTNPESQETESVEQINWKKFREERAKERKEKDELSKKVQEEKAKAEAMQKAMEALLNKPQQESRQEYEEESEEQRIERKVRETLVREHHRIEEEKKKQELELMPQKIQELHKDFYQICNQENVDYFEFHYPEIAKSFAYMPDGMEKWDSLYKAVKRLIPNAGNKKDQMKIEKNIKKPQSMSIPGATQTTDSAPVMLDDVRKADNWQRMQRRIKGL